MGKELVKSGRRGDTRKPAFFAILPLLFYTRHAQGFRRLLPSWLLLKARRTMTLDIRTLLAAFLSLGALSAAVSGYTWAMSRKRIGGTFQWFLGFVCLTAGMALLGLRGYLPEIPSILIGNGFVMAGAAFQVWGVGIFLGVERSKLYALPVAFAAIASAVLVFYTLIAPNLGARTITVSLYVSAISAFGLVLLALKPVAAFKRGARFAAMFYVCLVALFAARAVSVLFWPSGEDWMAAGNSDGIALLCALVFVCGIAFAGLELVNARLFTDFVTAAAEARERNEAYLAEAERRTLAENSLSEAKIEIASAQKEIMVTLSEVVESRSEETAHHVLRVSEYARILAKSLSLDEEDVALIADAAPMHDIGKIAVPDSVLKKPGPLTSAELAVMRTHTVIGRDILVKSRRKLMKTAATIAYEHHEYWNGSGYPEGKSGEAISIAGRVVSACDVFDALSVSRVYKAAWDLGRILGFFREQRGRMFEPRIVDALERGVGRFVEVSRRFPDAGTVTHGYGPG
jgi:HD-GYP domain-containing protein (c-di-GMP phosphodiesterase class II)